MIIVILHVLQSYASNEILLAGAYDEELLANPEIQQVVKDIMITTTVIISFFLLTSEVTQRRLFLPELSIRNEQIQQKEIIDNSPSGVAIVKRDHNEVLYLNESIRDLISIDLKEDNDLLSKVTFQPEISEKSVFEHQENNPSRFHQWFLNEILGDRTNLH